ncbi:MAG: Gfo/Idh/MocA family protein [Planctomycetota bacterium]|jgi:predicted dehydrogenase
MASPISAVIVGAGHRSLLYASYAKEHPEDLKIVGVVDPAPHRREQAIQAHDLSEEQCFSSVEELCSRGKIADAAINGTMDALHVPTTLPLLGVGYDVLLEKPFAINEAEMLELLAASRKHKRRVMICHVLRYAPFYRRIREAIAEGSIGRIMNIQTNEHVSYHHMATGFIRGKWAKEAECGSCMLMAKCCHDLDLIMWMNSGNAPIRTSSFGGRMHFRPEHAPEGAGTRCLKDCRREADCCYSAAQMYIDNKLWGFYAWEDTEHRGELTPEEKRTHLRDESAYGRCVWRCDMDIVDHQSVVMEFADGATATHNLVGGAPTPMRSIHILGTDGEIFGEFDSSRFTIRKANIKASETAHRDETVVDLNIEGDFHGMGGGHGGGDLRLVEDFVSVLRGEEPSISCTTIEDSVYGHLTGFRAEQSRKEGEMMELPAV